MIAVAAVAVLLAVLFAIDAATRTHRTSRKEQP